MKEIKFPFLKRVDAEVIDLWRTRERRAEVRSAIATAALNELRRVDGGHFLNWIPVEVSDDLYEHVWRQYHLKRIVPISVSEGQRFIDDVRIRVQPRKEELDAENARLLSRT